MRIATSSTRQRVVPPWQSKRTIAGCEEVRRTHSHPKIVSIAAVCSWWQHTARRVTSYGIALRRVDSVGEEAQWPEMKKARASVWRLEHT
ncbi:hypothetical protein SDJN03_28434, partial [Cucurbita argyrosperma subsp. sororia]